MLTVIESEVKISGMKPNCTMAAINNQKGSEKYAETAYKAVFGKDYNQHIKCSVSEACKCKMTEERFHVTNDPRLEAVTKDLFFLDAESTTISGILVKSLKVM